jgi:uncharacterized membrane protein required for colicin V production
MNGLDFILALVILIGVIIGLRRALLRVLISIVGIYFTVLVAAYVYHPMGWTLSEALNDLNPAFDPGKTAMYNISYLIIVACMTAIVELASASYLEDTHIPVLGRVDHLLGGVAGILYGALWASLLLMPVQYGIARSGGSWTSAVRQSDLVPILNEVFRNGVLEVVRLLLLDGIPPLYQPVFLR